MKMPKIIAIIFLITCWSLSHVYLQTEIIKLGYDIKSREDLYQQLVDNNNVLKYNIFVLESPYNLGKNILLSDSSMQILRPSQVLSFGSFDKKEAIMDEGQNLLEHPIFLAIRKLFSQEPAEARQ